jgi:hypothetical protein
LKISLAKDFISTTLERQAALRMDDMLGIKLQRGPKWTKQKQKTITDMIHNQGHLMGEWMDLTAACTSI